MKRDLWLCVSIYVLALVITLHYALFRQVITSDQMQEYTLYLEAVKTGVWEYQVNAIVNSSLTVTLFPALLTRLTGWDANIVFKAFPCLFFSLMPAFTYLIARRSLNWSYSVLAAGLVLSSFYFVFYPANGRVGVGLGFFAVMLWAVFAKRYVVAVIASLLMVISHYGTTLIAAMLLGAGWGMMLLLRHFNKELAWTGVVLVILVAGAYSWYWVISYEPGRYANGFVSQSIDSVNSALNTDRPPLPSDWIAPQEGKTLPDGTVETVTANFYSLEVRDPVVAVALGKYLDRMSAPQIIEWVLSWLIALGTTASLIFVTRKFPSAYSAMAVTGYGLIVIAVAVPFVSLGYGVIRTYFTALPLLAPVFCLGVKSLPERIGVRGELFLLGIIIPYAMCTSGIMHWIFGINKGF